MANFRAWWELKLRPDYQNGAHLELTEDDLGHIAELIQEGYTSGEIVDDSDDEDEAE